MGPSALMKSDEASEKFPLTLSSSACLFVSCVGGKKESVLPFLSISPLFKRGCGHFWKINIFPEEI